MFSGSDDLEQLLIQPETTVEEVLKYVHFTDELSTRNPALLEFLAQPDRVRDLVELVRRGPDLSCPSERQYQLAYLATEALTSETWTIQDALLQNEEALDGLYSILQTEDPASLPPLTASFLHRILVYLSKWAGLELLSFLKSKPDFVDCVIRHMDKAAVPEIVYHLLNTANYKTFLSICQWLDEAQLVSKLLDRFLCDDFEVRGYACQFICGLIYVCRSHRYRFLRPLSEDSQTNLLLSRLESEETFERVLSAVFSDDTHLLDNRQFIPMALCLLRNILIPSTQ
ncbi:unnamed protein product [Dibothriocephalus latus]|uniref:Serine/threonine-protein phosphatase 4 regulatory subunit 3-like central domain-containing protein n=1 Tax=Dibothriocephalus latus TaxID=60516 RepID=A0A3P7NKH9_DIBLA|nr:unnamed protein product [Dibothriocephalus latus]